MNQIETLMSIYEQIDYDSLSIDKIIPSQGEPINDITWITIMRMEVQEPESLYAVL